MSVLLREAHGFEGLGSVGGMIDADDLPASHREDAACREAFDFNAAAATASLRATEDDDRITCVDQFGDLNPIRLPEGSKQTRVLTFDFVCTVELP